MKWYLKFKDGESFESESMIETNAKVLQKSEDPLIMEVKHIDKLYKVDFGTGNLYCNGDLIFQNTLKGTCRWVSFREVTAIIGTSEESKITNKEYYFGWQTTIDGINYKRFIKIDLVGNVELILRPEGIHAKR